MTTLAHEPVLPTPELLSAGREIGEPRLSPDGRTVAFTVSWGHRSGIAVVPVEGGPERVLTTSPEPRPGRGGSFGWSPAGDAVVYAAEDGNLWRQPYPGGPPTRLTDLPDGAAPQAPAVSPDGRSVAFVTDLARVLVVASDGSMSMRTVGDTGDFVVDPAWSPAGSLVWHEWSVPAMAWDESSVVVEERDGTRTTIGRPGTQVQQPRFGPDGALWTLRDDFGWLNVWRGDEVFLAEPFEHGRPTWGAGQRSYAVAPDGAAVAVARNEAGFGRLALVTAAGDVRPLGRGVHSELDWVGSNIVAIRSGATTPPQLVAYDAESGARRVLVTGAPLGWDAVGLVEPDTVTWIGEDGTELYGRHYRSTAPERGRGLLCWLHGGPTDQAMVAFNARYAYWIARGFDVFVPDFRGSTGHGRGYQQAMRERWGDLDVSDVVSGLRHAHREGWGSPVTTVVTGGSAGGFTALLVVARAPDLVAGAVVSYPVTDLIALDETTHRFEAHYTNTLVGSRPGADARYVERSPMASAHLVRRPVLVFHGDRDPVVDVDQSGRFVALAGEAGARAELVVYEGERHGFKDPEHVADELRRTESFLDGVVRRADPLDAGEQ